MSSPLVTVVVPVYKVEPFIERCLLSVLRQSYRDIECIVVNDRTPDRSAEIAADFIAAHPEFNCRIIHQPENMGLSMARNAGMDAAMGKYIYFLDSDDEITEYAIEHLVELAEETNAEVVLGHSVCINEEEGWERDYFPIASMKDFIEGNSEILESFVHGKYPVMACDKLTRMDFLMKHQLYFVKDLFSQDVLWSFQSALKLERIAFLREDTYLYYFHGASIIHNRGDKHFRNWITIAQHMDAAYRKETDPARKNLILKYLVGFKAQTLEMNWKAQKSEELWKKSYKEYRKLKGLSMRDYMSKEFSKEIKKQDLFTALPVDWGFRVFKWRYNR